jgi:predicted unusual protein kinase regulating ubiquinone biosynthesis (AarF/ABC1/UbiB family)
MAMATTKIRLLGQRMYRARRVASTFGRIYLQIKANQFMARHTDEFEMRLRWARFNRRSAESIFETAVELRGLILKACQFVGSRTDVLPPEYCEVLSQLQDRVPPRPFSEIRTVVERELGMPLDQAFSDFSEKSVASASLAQVHQAHLPDGRRVAVKVQYPEIPELVRSDLSNLNALFQAVGLVERNFDLIPLIDELTEHLPRELDFCNEARNSERVAKFFENRDDLFIPAIHWELTTTRLLVSEFVDGIKINDTRGLETAGISCAAVMQSLVEAYCEQILVHGFFHADPHPGNLMVLPPTAEDEPPTVVFLDFGLAKRLPPAFRQSAVEFAAALLQGNSRAMGSALIDLGFETREDSPKALQLIAEILLNAAKRLRNQAHLDPDVIREAGENLARVIRENPIIRIPSHIVLLGRVFGLLSGVGHTLGVLLDMLQTILPYAAGVSPSSSTERGGA